MTEFPAVDGDPDDTRVVDVVVGGAALTTWVTVFDVGEASKFVSPLYTAVIGWVPAAV